MNAIGRIAALSLALSLAFALTACSGNANSESKDIENSQSNEASFRVS